MLRKKVVKWFKIIPETTKDDFFLSSGDSISITMAGPVNDLSLAVSGTKKAIKYFVKRHRNLIANEEK
ncbi:MAG: hypothetical protein A3J64_01365 [Candidatus Portnoybacteria bacterium RIFCSPHIGHO2_12_FULL_38_9]|uniref:Uncharacterized protein n=1 Tax=Candidatus Portnoybacteria bacterium RIFCSPHIGHO2_12_FULL_38_9 TaxID=1801997 RepID=A0A1G2FGP6_9BACT|nr:MAG: hypothetical protein A3J64_01365 [Candidatus Portnoybacteria bacterium RIFCSPHIGHO2_12_FULL_38_9]